MRGQPGHNIRPHPRLPHSFLGLDARMTLQLRVALIFMLSGSLVCWAYFFDLLSLVVCITRHWQTSGRLVQELNVCTGRPDVCTCLAVQTPIDDSSNISAKHINDSRSLQIKATFIFEVIYASIPRKRDGYRVCGRVSCLDYPCI